MQTIQLYIQQHNGYERIFISAHYNSALNTLLKKQQGIKWSQTHKQWHMPVNETLYKQLCHAVKDIAIIDHTALKKQLQKKKQTSTPAIPQQPKQKAPTTKKSSNSKHFVTSHCSN